MHYSRVLYNFTVVLVFLISSTSGIVHDSQNNDIKFTPDISLVREKRTIVKYLFGASGFNKNFELEKTLFPAKKAVSLTKYPFVEQKAIVGVAQTDVSVDSNNSNSAKTIEEQQQIPQFKIIISIQQEPSSTSHGLSPNLIIEAKGQTGPEQNHFLQETGRPNQKNSNIAGPAGYEYPKPIFAALTGSSEVQPVAPSSSSNQQYYYYRQQPAILLQPQSGNSLQESAVSSHNVINSQAYSQNVQGLNSYPPQSDVKIIRSVSHQHFQSLLH